jgi:hypothetical protein
MNLSTNTQILIGQIGSTISELYMMKLSPLQILALVEIRFAEAKLQRNKHLFAHQVRSAIAKMYSARGFKPPSRQLFWKALDELQDRKLIYVAPHKKGTRYRALMLTLQGSQLFSYPPSIHPYKVNNQPTSTP